LNQLLLKKKQHQVLSFLIQQRKNHKKGKIIAVGNGTKENKITVKVGDQVLYGKYSGTELNINGIDYLIMKESDIFGTV
jgi:chaperonin GroES